MPVVSVGDGTCRMQTLRLQTGTLSPISLTRMGSSPAQAEAIPYLVDLVAREPMPEKFFELITESVRILREKNAFCSLGFSQPSCPKDRPKDHGGTISGFWGNRAKRGVRHDGRVGLTLNA